MCASDFPIEDNKLSSLGSSLPGKGIYSENANNNGMIHPNTIVRQSESLEKNLKDEAAPVKSDGVAEAESEEAEAVWEIVGEAEVEAEVEVPETCSFGVTVLMVTYELVVSDSGSTSDAPLGRSEPYSVVVLLFARGKTIVTCDQAVPVTVLGE